MWPALGIMGKGPRVGPFDPDDMRMYIRYLGWLGLLWGGLSWGQGLEVNPVRLAFAAGEGEARIETITVRNKSAKRNIFVLSAEDWTLNEAGKMVRIPPDSAGDYSCRSWLSFVPAMLELGPGEAQEVRVRMDVPAGAPGTHWCVVDVTLKREKQARTGEEQLAMGIEIRQAIGVLVTQAPPGAADLRLLAGDLVETTQATDTVRQFELMVENVGRDIFEGEARLALSSLLDAREETLSTQTVKILPGGKLRLRWQVAQDQATGPCLLAGIVKGEGAEAVAQLIAEW